MFVEDRFDMTKEDNIFCAKRILVDSVYQQANLEGIAVTYAQTQDILNNINIPKLTPNEINKICCLRDGWHFLLDNIDAPVNVGYLQSIHEIIARFDVPYTDLGKMRTNEVMISGTNWRPGYPDIERIHQTIIKMLESPNKTDAAIRLGLYIMREQPFRDGNKRVGSFVANKILIENGKGIFNVPTELDGEFKQRLVNYYETNNADDLISWIHGLCIQGTNEIKRENQLNQIKSDFQSERVSVRQQLADISNELAKNKESGKSDNKNNIFER